MGTSERVTRYDAGWQLEPLGKDRGCSPSARNVDVDVDVVLVAFHSLPTVGISGSSYSDDG